MIDLGSIVKAEDTFDVNLKHPGTGEVLGVIIKVHGMDSDVYRSTSHLQRSRRMKAVKVGRLNMTPDDLEKDALELLAACTAGWDQVTVNGEALAFSKANALKLYTDYPWIREQVDEAVSDRANFTRES